MCISHENVLRLAQTDPHICSCLFCVAVVFIFVLCVGIIAQNYPKKSALSIHEPSGDAILVNGAYHDCNLQSLELTPPGSSANFTMDFSEIRKLTQNCGQVDNVFNTPYPPLTAAAQNVSVGFPTPNNNPQLIGRSYDIICKFPVIGSSGSSASHVCAAAGSTARDTAQGQRTDLPDKFMKASVPPMFRPPLATTSHGAPSEDVENKATQMQIATAAESNLLPNSANYRSRSAQTAYSTIPHSQAPNDSSQLIAAAYGDGFEPDIRRAERHSPRAHQPLYMYRASCDRPDDVAIEMDGQLAEGYQSSPM